MLLEFTAGSIQTRSDCPFRDVHHLGNLPVGQRLNFLKNENGSQFGVDSLESLVKQVSAIMSVILFRLLAHRVHQQGLEFPAALLPEKLQCLVRGQSIQPGLKA